MWRVTLWSSYQSLHFKLGSSQVISAPSLFEIYSSEGACCLMLTSEFKDRTARGDVLVLRWHILISSWVEELKRGASSARRFTFCNLCLILVAYSAYSYFLSLSGGKCFAISQYDWEGDETIHCSFVKMQPGPPRYNNIFKLMYGS